MLGYEVTLWYGVLAPTGTSAAVATKWNREVPRILQLPYMEERFVAQGIDLASNTPEAFGHLIKSKVPRCCKTVKDSGTKVD